jgi:hypothetical protein
MAVIPPDVFTFSIETLETQAWNLADVSNVTVLFCNARTVPVSRKKRKPTSGAVHSPPLYIA